MKLTELDPRFTKILETEPRQIFDEKDVDIKNADGIIFLCPKCFVKNDGPIGTHSVMCWQPHIPQTITPKPGRWKFEGTGYDDLSLVAGSSSIKLTGGCEWHGFVKKGEVTGA